ncbi:MAG: 5-formyltetrahydrofolate cyclo-ligase [Ferruginibacter sp.]
MIKEQLRKLYKEKRASITASEKLKMDDLLLIQFQKLALNIPALIMTYAPFEKMNEFDPQTIADYCYFKNFNQQLFYPVISKYDDQMSCVLVNDQTIFELNKYGIAEPIDAVTMFPEEIDWVFIPLLAFDVRGHRVGYGKGYYDRFLKQCRNDVVKIGFSYFEAEPIISDSNRFDVKLNYCITPEKNYQF